jgi:hypothetical protein
MPIQIKPRALTAFRRTPEVSSDAAKSLPQKYFVSPEVFAEEPSFAKATARQAGNE